MLGSGTSESLSLGQLGSDFIRDTGAYVATTHSGPNKNGWGIIEAMTDTVFSVLTSGKYPANPVTGVTAGDIMTHRPNNLTFTLFKGQRLYGIWTAITLTSGSVIAYRI